MAILPQKFIEDLPFEEVHDGNNVTLKDLLGELSEFSEDEDWRELIASVHGMYDADRKDATGMQSDKSLTVDEDEDVLCFGGAGDKMATDDGVGKGLEEEVPALLDEDGEEKVGRWESDEQVNSDDVGSGDAGSTRTKTRSGELIKSNVHVGDSGHVIL